jgi:hypothetical protein
MCVHARLRLSHADANDSTRYAVGDQESLECDRTDETLGSEHAVLCGSANRVAKIVRSAAGGPEWSREWNSRHAVSRGPGCQGSRGAAPDETLCDQEGPLRPNEVAPSGRA